MPQKVITEEITSSQSWRRLTGPARELFVPLLVKTDAWGIRKADLEEIRLDCIPGYDWPDSKLLAALESLVREEVIELYLAEGRWYLRVTNHDRFQRQLVRLRRGRSRFPLPPELPSTAARSLLVRRYFDAALVHARDSGLLPVKPVIEEQAFLREQTSGARDNGNGLDFSLERDHELWRLVDEVSNADDGTLHVFRTLRDKGLPPAAFASAREALLERRRHPSKPALQSEARFVHSELKRALEEGRYAA